MRRRPSCTCDRAFAPPQELKDVARLKEAAELMKDFLQQDADGAKALTAGVDAAMRYLEGCAGSA